MYAPKTDFPYGTNQKDGISKREQRKIQQMMKQFEANEINESSHKKRKHTKQIKSDPQARKIVKTESQISETKNKDCSSSGKQLSEEGSKVIQKTVDREIKDLHNILNKNYVIPEQSGGFSEYMINYIYGEKSKHAEKQCEDWNDLINLGGKKVETKSSKQDEELTKKINGQLALQGERAQELFSKSNKQFVRKVFCELLPKGN